MTDEDDDLTEEEFSERIEEADKNNFELGDSEGSESDDESRMVDPFDDDE